MSNWATDEEFLQTFRAEALERLQTLSSGLMSLENSPADDELLKKLFREAHTLKGSAGMMGLDAIRELAHRVEDILETVQTGQMRMESGVADLLLETLDRIEQLLPGEEPGEPASVADVSGLLERLREVGSGGQSGAAAPAPSLPVTSDGQPDQTPAPIAKSGTANPEVEAAEASTPEPEAPQLKVAANPLETGGETSQPVSGPPAEVRGQESEPPRKEPLLKAVGQQPEAPKPAAPARQEKAPAAPAGKAASAAAPRSQSTIRVNIERLDKLLNLMGEILVNQSDAEDRIKEMASIHKSTDEIQHSFAALAQQIRKMKSGAGETDLGDIKQRVNRMEDALSVTVDRLGAAATRLEDNTAGRKIALDDLQDQALHVRMLPLGSIFSLYPRVVRDAAGACGKKVRLEISGEETEMDKRLLEQIADPLMHIMRNAVDHGIELPLQRTEQGKPEQGVIRLSAAQRGDRVEIEVADDGAGIIPEKIKAAAERKGLLGSGEQLSNEEAIELIFRPGFSTAEAVTTISGRGVGLDVVKNNIEHLEGSVLVESTPGQGTRFLVSLPVTLAVINGMLVECGDARFVIPMTAVQELVAVDKEELQSLGSHPGFILRGSAVPLVNLLEFLGGSPSSDREGRAQVVVVRAERYRLGLEVGRLVGEQELVIKSLGGFLPRMPYVAGVTVMGDGQAVLVLNINQLVRDIKNGGKEWRPAAGAEAAERASGPRRSILVVEDSLVVRELQRNILEAAGYEVETAVDGNDAMTHLMERQVDCVVTDLEMPGMDGLNLISAIRRTDDLKDIPVVMVTSRNSEEDKRRGVEAGANAYVTKGTFDQQNLLDTIKRLVA